MWQKVLEMKYQIVFRCLKSSIWAYFNFHESNCWWHIYVFLSYSFNIDNLYEERAYLINLNLSLCYEANQPCDIIIPIMVNNLLRKQVCDWGTEYRIPGKLVHLKQFYWVNQRDWTTARLWLLPYIGFFFASV